MSDGEVDLTISMRDGCEITYRVAGDAEAMSHSALSNWPRDEVRGVLEVHHLGGTWDVIPIAEIRRMRFQNRPKRDL